MERAHRRYEGDGAAALAQGRDRPVQRFRVTDDLHGPMASDRGEKAGW